MLSAIAENEPLAAHTPLQYTRRALCDGARSVLATALSEGERPDRVVLRPSTTAGYGPRPWRYRRTAIIRYVCCTCDQARAFVVEAPHFPYDATENDGHWRNS